MDLEDSVYKCIAENNRKYNVKEIAEILKHDRVFDIEMVVNRYELDGEITGYLNEKKLSVVSKKTEFKDLNIKDKEIICNLMRMRIENIDAEFEDFDGLSDEGLEYYKKSLIESLPDEYKE